MATTLTIPTLDLAGKKTYIMGVIGLAYVWIDHFYGIGLSDSCKALAAMAPAQPCTMPLDTAIQMSIALVMGMFLRSAVTTEAAKAA